jgi:CheY-like chemotaxis protein
VLRHEIADAQGLVTRVDAPPPNKLSHDLRNRLNTANLALHLSQKQLQAGLMSQAEGTLQKALDEFAALEEFVTKIGRAPDEPAVVRRALLVEDNANESALLAGYLQMSGFEVDTVCDGLEAIHYLSENKRPDIILLDMRMPRLDGPGTVSSIRSNPQLGGLRLFAVSGSDRDELAVSVGPDGVDHWFSKPVNPRQMVAEIDRRLQENPVPA